METVELRELLETLTNPNVNLSAKTEQLHVLSTLLSDPSSGSAIVEVVPLPALFSCLKLNNRELTSASCLVLGKLLPRLDVKQVSRILLEHLVVGLTHSVEDVRQLCLRQLMRFLDSEQLCSSLLEAPDGVRVTQCLKDSSLSCAKSATDLLSGAARRYDSCARLLLSADSLHCQELLSVVDAKEDVMRYRVFAMVADISAHSVELLQLCVDAGLLGKLLADLDKEDVLVRMNCFEVLHALAGSAHGLSYLDETGSLGKAAQFLTSADDPFSHLLLPGVFKFFGHLCCLSNVGISWLNQRVPDFLPSMLSALEAEDASLFPILIDTFCVVASSHDGRCLLLSHPSRGTKAFQVLNNVIRSAPSELRIRCLDGLCTIYRASPSGLEASTLSAVHQHWYVEGAPTNQSTVELVWKVAREPFQNVRYAALQTLAAMAKWPFVASELVKLSGFLEYALNRATESERLNKEAKFELIQQLALSDTVRAALDAPVLMKLRLYVRQGPLFVLAESSVKTEEPS